MSTAGIGIPGNLAAQGLTNKPEGDKSPFFVDLRWNIKFDIFSVHLSSSRTDRQLDLSLTFRGYYGSGFAFPTDLSP